MRKAQLHPDETVSSGSSLAVYAFQTPSRANGGVVSLTEILRRLRSYHPILITQAETEVTALWRRYGYEVHVWPVPAPFYGATSRLRRSGALAMTNVRIHRLLRKRGIRVLHCNDVSALWHSAFGARRAGSRIVFNLRDTTGVRGAKWQISRTLADRVVVLSHEMQRYVERTLAQPSWLRWRKVTPVEAIYSIVDTTLMRPVAEDVRVALRERLKIGAGEFAIVIVGVVAPKKQQLQLLEHIARRRSHLPRQAKFYFVGDFDPEETYSGDCLRVVAQGHLNDRVRFVGFTQEVWRWYQSADIALLPSHEEGLARSMIESIACGTPVVAFDVCSTREILEHHGCGVVVQQGDFDGLLDAAQALASDRERRAALGAVGPSVASELFAPGAIARAYERLYEEVLQ